MMKIEADLNVTKEANPEIGQRWFPTAIMLKYTSIYPAAQRYVSI
jgi:hypothetical protein